VCMCTSSVGLGMYRLVKGVLSAVIGEQVEDGSLLNR